MTDRSNPTIANETGQSVRYEDRMRLMLLRGIAGLACVVALLTLWLTPPQYPKFPIDAY